MECPVCLQQFEGQDQLRWHIQCHLPHPAPEFHLTFDAVPEEEDHGREEARWQPGQPGPEARGRGRGGGRGGTRGGGTTRGIISFPSCSPPGSAGRQGQGEGEGQGQGQGEGAGHEGEEDVHRPDGHGPPPGLEGCLPQSAVGKGAGGSVLRR
eukprot:8560912-Heterocapsa_arctica.AAC.1